MSPQYLLVRLDVSQRADVIALRDGLGQLKASVKAAADAVVAAHGDVAQSGDLLVAAAGLLPGLDQRTVVEIEIERVVCIFDEIHLEHPSGRAGEQRLSQALEAFGAALFLQVGALRNAASRDSRRGSSSRILTMSLFLILASLTILDMISSSCCVSLPFARAFARQRRVYHISSCLSMQSAKNRSFFDEGRKIPGAQSSSERPGVWFCDCGCVRCVICFSSAARHIRYGALPSD